MEPRTPVLVAAALTLVLATLPLVHAGDQEIGDTTVFTRVPDPGSPEGIAVHDGKVYVGTHTPVFGNADGPPSAIFVYDLASGQELDRFAVEGQEVDETHGTLGMTLDGEGNLYVADRNPPRVLRFDLSTSPPTQSTYAELRDLPTCPPGEVPMPSPPIECSPNTIDQAPFPDGITFDAQGFLYVTDLEQAVLWRIPPGGGQAEVWYADERLDSVFATNGIAVGPTDGLLYIAMTGQMRPWTEEVGAGGAATVLTTQGAIYTLPTVQAPQSEDLGVFHVFPEPAAGPDGLAFGASGSLYVALAGHSQVAVLDADGREEVRFPGPVENQLMDVPYDLPASLAFDDGDRSLLVTNQAFFTGNSDHWAVLEAYVDDTAAEQPRPSLP